MPPLLSSHTLHDTPVPSTMSRSPILRTVATKLAALTVKLVLSLVLCTASMRGSTAPHTHSTLASKPQCRRCQTSAPLTNCVAVSLGEAGIQ